MKRLLAPAAMAAALLCTSAIAQTKSHGAVYEIIDDLMGLEEPVEAPVAPQGLDRLRFQGLAPGPVPPRADPAPRIGSFFVTVFEADGVTPLDPAQSRALSRAIGSQSLANLNNPEIPAGFTFLGQFLDHDVTRNEMIVAEKLVANDLLEDLPEGGRRRNFVREVLLNARSSLLDLDSVYGLSLAQIEELIETLDTDAICPVDIDARRPGCIDLSGLDDADRRALATYERGPGGRLTGRFEIAFRTDGPDGRTVPDLPRCSDDARFAVSPACRIDAAQSETLTDVLHRAIIGDGRNDENIIIAQIHLAFLLAHNRLLDAALEARGLTVADASPQEKLAAFRTARRTLIDHWQAIVLDDYLTVHVGAALVDELETGEFSFYTLGDGQPYCAREAGAMPHEFAVGAFRHGHSQVRAGYVLNESGGVRRGAGFGDLFGDTRITPDRAIDFRFFFEGVRRFDPTAPESPAGAPTPSQRIDTVLSPPLAQLLAPSIPKLHVGHQRLGDLAARNLARVGDRPVAQPDGAVGLTPVQIRFGTGIAEALKARGVVLDVLTDAEVAGLPIAGTSVVQAAFPDGLEADHLPLWAYVLAEAEIQQGGERLGDVGGRIVAETLVGLIRCDADGILAEGADFEPSMVPTGGLVQPGEYRMADLVNFAHGG